MQPESGDHNRRAIKVRVTGRPGIPIENLIAVCNDTLGMESPRNRHQQADDSCRVGGGSVGWFPMVPPHACESACVGVRAMIQKLVLIAFAGALGTLARYGMVTLEKVRVIAYRHNGSPSDQAVSKPQ